MLFYLTCEQTSNLSENKWIDACQFILNRLLYTRPRENYNLLDWKNGMTAGRSDEIVFLYFKCCQVLTLFIELLMKNRQLIAEY